MKQPGQSLMDRGFGEQTAEVRIRAVKLNRFTALGAPTAIRVV